MLLIHDINWEIVKCLNEACRRCKSRCIHFYLYLYIHVIHIKMMMMETQVHNVILSPATKEVIHPLYGIRAVTLNKDY